MLCCLNRRQEFPAFSSLFFSFESTTETYPTSLSSIAPGWKGGKLPPLGGSLGEYSLNDFDEQPAHEQGRRGKKRAEN